MKLRSSKMKWVLTAAVISGGSMLQLGSCTPGSVLSTLGGVNPCGTVLNCDARTYNFIKAGYNGPGVNPNVDIFCTYPPFCTAEQDPIFGALTP